MANQNPTSNCQTITLASAIHKIQLSLIDTPSTAFSLLLHAGTLLAEPDYEDVVTERNISNLCGYPSCQNPRKFNAKRSKSPKYRISLKEHKVYDLQEGYKYCGEECLISSRAFKESLDAQRRAEVDLSRKKVEDVLRLFGYYDGKEEDGRKKDLKKLQILEKEEVGASEINLDGVMANAIEGYVPKYNSGSQFAPALETGQQIDGAQTSQQKVDNATTKDKSIGSSPKLCSTSTDDVSDMITKMLEDVSITEGNLNGSCLKSHHSKSQKKEVNKNVVVVDNGDMGFTSSIIFGNELDATLPKTCDVSEQISKRLDDLLMSEKTPSKSKPLKSPRSKSTNKVDNNKSEKAKFSSTLTDDSTEQSAPTTSSKSKDSKHDAQAEDVSKSIGISLKKKEVLQNNCLRPSLKTSKSNGKNQSVKWADVKKKETLQNIDILETTQGENTDPRIASAEACVAALSQAAEAVASVEAEVADAVIWADVGKKETLQNIDILETTQGENTDPRIASAEACVAALSQAAEAASGGAEVADAVSEAGIVILPQPQQAENTKSDANEEEFNYEREVSKWPKKTVLLETDMFEVEDSWHDTVPEGFSLTLSTFATMWMALSSWLTCSSIAYIYGHDDNSKEDFLYVNGTEYPHKIFIVNGKSSEIRLALDGFISRALPGLVMDLGLRTPVSTLGKYVARLLDTMSFVESLPSFRMKQWQTIVLLFIEALTVSRLPSLAPHLTGRNMQLDKMLQGAKVSMEEYEIMREFIMPLGHLPQ